MNINASEQNFPHDESVHWLDRIAATLPGRKYSVEIRFDSPEEKLLQGLLDDINDLNNRLSSFSETSLQVSGNISNNCSTSGAIQQEAFRTVMGTVRDTPSYGMSVSSSRIFNRANTEYINDKLKFCAARLNQMLMCGAHAVSIIIEAEDEVDLRVLESVLSGAMAFNGIIINWHKDSSALLLPNHALHIMFSLPSRDFPGF